MHIKMTQAACSLLHTHRHLRTSRACVAAQVSRSYASRCPRTTTCPWFIAYSPSYPPLPHLTAVPGKWQFFLGLRTVVSQRSLNPRMPLPLSLGHGPFFADPTLVHGLSRQSGDGLRRVDQTCSRNVSSRRPRLIQIPIPHGIV